MNMQQVFKELKKDFTPEYYISVESKRIRYSNTGTGSETGSKQIYVAYKGRGKGIFCEASTWEETLKKFRANWTSEVEDGD